MRILLTGVTGCLGEHIARAAVARDHELLCLVRNISTVSDIVSQSGRVRLINYKENIEYEIGNFSPDVFIHTAWQGVRELRDDSNVQRTNIVLFSYLLSLYSYKQVLALGSQDEYGFYSAPVKEECVPKPISEYGKAKVECSRILAEYGERTGAEWQWIRVFTVYGEGQRGGLIPAVVRSCMRDDFFPTTEGNQVYSYLYAGDFAEAICNILGEKGKSGIYNLSQGEELHSNKEVINTIVHHLKSTITVEFGAIPYPRGQIMLMHGDSTKFRAAFGSIPHTNFLTSLQLTVQSLLK